MHFSWLKTGSRIGAAFATLALLGLSAPSVARAGCNHLIDARSAVFEHSGRLDGLITGEPATPRGDPVPGKPCSGPGCSSRAPIPVPTASTGLEGVSQWGALESGFILETLAPLRLTLEAPFTLPTAPVSAIFHPPRGR